ncbi:MAG: hypothetical protein ACYC27_06900 [Armatimonadota bacterium]
MQDTWNNRGYVLAVITGFMLLLLPSIGKTATINSLRANSDTIGRYEKYEITFNLSGISTSDFNPFRPETTGDSMSPAGADVRAEIVTPSGTTKVVNGYYDIDYTYYGNLSKAGQTGADRMVPVTAPHWHVRYAPMELGIHKVTLKVTDASGTATASTLSFNSIASSNHGFIKISKDGTRMAYSDDTPFVPFGTMMPYGTAKVAPMMTAMKANGMNLVRRWLVDRDQEDIYRALEGWSSSTSYDSSTYRTGKRSAIKNVSGAGTLVDQSFIGCKPDTYYKAFIYIKTSTSFNGQAAVNLVEDRSDGSSTTRTGNTVGTGQNWALSQIVFRTGTNAEMLHFKPKAVSGSTGSVWLEDAGLYECDASGNVTVDANMVFNPSFESWSPTQLRMVALARFEYLLQQAEENGVVVQPAIFNYRLWNPSNPTGLYAAYFGDFFTDTESISQQQRVLRYLVARFGHYRSLMGWELTNEMDSAYTEVRGTWLKNHALYLKKCDPYRHIITNSLWRSPGDPEYSQMPDIDINQVHYYINTEERAGGQGVPTWWTQSSSTVIDATSTNAYSGKKSLKVTANGSSPSEGGTAYCQPGRSFTLRAKIKLSSVTGSANIIGRTFTVGGTQLSTPVNISATGTSAYKNYEQTFTAGSTTGYITVDLRVTGSSGTAWFDDIEIIDNTTGRNIFYNGSFESPNFGDDEYEWGLYNTYRSQTVAEAGPTGTKKPWGSGEFGLMGVNADLSLWANPKDTTKPRHDSTGIHVHNCLWAQLMASGTMNTPTYWWMDEYLLAYNLLGVWKGATVFASKLPFYSGGKSVCTTPYPADVQAQSSNGNIRVLGQKSSNSGYLWIQNSQYTWSRVIRDGVNPSANSAVITIPEFSNGTYTVQWYDTNTGSVIKTENINVSNGVLSLSVSSLTKDTAVIIKSETAVSTSPKITLTLSVDKANAKSGETVTYTILYKNDGNGPANKVEIRLPIPANTSYITGSASNSGTLDAAGNSICWAIPTVAAGASGQVTTKFIIQ